MQLIFATHNHNKVLEVKAALAGDYEIISLADLQDQQPIEEPYNTLAENAAEKVNVIWNRYGKNSFSEDTGLEIAALDMRPGVRSARYAGEQADSAANMAKVLHELREQSDRSAQFRTVFALRWDDELHFFEGIVEGQILESPQGNGGFGYDPIFKPLGYDYSFAELGIEVKKKISHRSMAFNKMINFIQSINKNKNV